MPTLPTRLPRKPGDVPAANDDLILDNVDIENGQKDGEQQNAGVTFNPTDFTPENSEGGYTEATEEESATMQNDGESQEDGKPNEKPLEDGVMITPTMTPNSAPAAPKMVKIRLKRDHNCTIGGVHYHFEKGKVVSAPTNVRNILLQANLLDPI